MGNFECSEVYHMGRDAGIIPDPHMDHLFTDYLSINSSTLLNSHYMDVSRTLSPEQLGVFNHSLRATLGESGKVRQGGVGVVALALSLLFDVLAEQAKNQTGTPNFIDRVFREREDGNVSEVGTVISDYLNLVPLIANDPQRMKEETQRYEQKLNRSLVSHLENKFKILNNSWTNWKILIHGLVFIEHMVVHQVRMGADKALHQQIKKDWDKHLQMVERDGPRSLVEITNVAERLRSINPEKHQLLSRCEDNELFFFFLIHLAGTIRKFEVKENFPTLISQNEDFFY